MQSASAPAASARTAPSSTPMPGADRTHLERVGDHEPAEAELLAKQPGQDPADSAWPARRRARERGGARSSPPARRPRSRPGTAAARARDRPSTAGSSRCESTAVSPWPGKCLAQAATPCRCVPADERSDVAGDERRGRRRSSARRSPGSSGFVFTSATGARFRFTPARASSPAIAAATSSVSAGSSTTPSARLPGKELPVAASSLVTSPPSSSIATRISRSPRRRAVRAASCSGSRDVVGEERDPAEAALELSQHPVGHVVAGKARQQAGAGEPLDVRHDLTAPAVSPKAIRRCTSTKKTTTGSAVSVAPAISEPQSVPRSVVKLASQIVSVCLSGLESRT